MTDLATALALILVIEGLIYAAFPNQMKRMMLTVLAMPSGSLRTVGLLAAVIGVAIVWALRG